MLLSELITELQYRVEDDSDNSRFPEDQKIDAINNAYYTLLSIVDDKSLSKFKLTETSITLTLDNNTRYMYYRFRGNIPLRIVNAMTDGFTECKIVSKDELFSKSPSYKYGALVALCSKYTYGDATEVYCTPNTVSRLKLWYIQEVEGMRPTDEYPINDSFKPILLGLAESELFRSDNASGRAKEAYAEAINILQAQEGK